MSETMIERVAKELCQCDERDGAAPWEWYDDKGKDGYRERARAVLTTLRDEPSEAMLDAGAGLEESDCEGGGAGWVDRSDVFYKMIDAALSEGNG